MFSKKSQDMTDYMCSTVCSNASIVRRTVCPCAVWCIWRGDFSQVSGFSFVAPDVTHWGAPAFTVKARTRCPALHAISPHLTPTHIHTHTQPLFFFCLTKKCQINVYLGGRPAHTVKITMMAHMLPLLPLLPLLLHAMPQPPPTTTNTLPQMMPTIDEDPPLASGVGTVAEEGLLLVSGAGTVTKPLVPGVVKKKVSMLPVVLVLRGCIIWQSTTESRRARIRPRMSCNLYE